MEVVKTNLASEYPAKLEIRMQRSESGVCFEYGPVATTVRDEEPSAEEWLLDFLTCNGPTKFRELVDAANADGFSKTTIYRARKKLGGRIIDSEGRQGKGNRWCLVEDSDDEQAEPDGDE